VDALKPGGVLALVTSHYTLDKQSAALREQLAAKADFLGAIRLPSEAFKRQGTDVVTDILFLKKREEEAEPSHADPEWTRAEALNIEGADIPINLYFHRHPEMALGTWGREGRLYPGDYSLLSNGELAEQLRAAIERLPEGVYAGCSTQERAPPPLVSFTPPPPLAHIDEGSFFVGEDKTLLQVQGGQAVPVTHGDTPLKANGTMMGQRLAALIELRDHARHVLRSQNEGILLANSKSLSFSALIFGKAQERLD
jgi:hypothetical protein